MLCWTPRVTQSNTLWHPLQGMSQLMLISGVFEKGSRCWLTPSVLYDIFYSKTNGRHDAWNGAREVSGYLPIGTSWCTPACTSSSVLQSPAISSLAVTTIPIETAPSLWTDSCTEILRNSDGKRSARDGLRSAQVLHWYYTHAIRRLNLNSGGVPNSWLRKKHTI